MKKLIYYTHTKIQISFGRQKVPFLDFMSTRGTSGIPLIYLFLLILFSCQEPEPDISETIFPVQQWTTITQGTMPLVLIAPHGGSLKPEELPDRTCSGCVVLNDVYTQELATAIDLAFINRIGKRPFVIINKLHRIKFDGNRDRVEATGGYAPLDQFWVHFHNAIDTARIRALRLHNRALVIDLHGHGHDNQRLELGYLLSAVELRGDATTLDQLLSGESSISGLAQSSSKGIDLLRGTSSLGHFFQGQGVPAVPSPQDLAPRNGEPYFNGGFNTYRYGSINGSKSDAIQIECHSTGIRNSATARAAFAEKFVTAVLAFMEANYNWK